MAIALATLVEVWCQNNLYKTSEACITGHLDGQTGSLENLLGKLQWSQVAK